MRRAIIVFNSCQSSAQGGANMDNIPEERSKEILAANEHAEPLADPRRLIVCFDGTSDLFDADNTNVVRFVSYLKKEDMSKQQVYYQYSQTGIGTYINPGMLMPLTVKFLELADEVVAWNLSDHIMGGYRFLMANWTPGTKISIFGFSRGAYTARALAGMLHKVGLLSRGNDEQIPFAYKIYAKDTVEGWQMSAAFQRTFCHEVTIDFLGVWDTVSSIGLFTIHDLPFSASNHQIRVFRHAVSLDERRCKFKANLWHHSTGPPDLDLNAGEISSTWTRFIRGRNGKVQTNQEDGIDGPGISAYPFTTDVEEIWFAGGHGDVGGGNCDNSVQSSSNRIPLVWMIREVVLANTAILFDEEALEADGIVLPVVRQPKDASMPDNRVSTLDLRYNDDVLSTITDQLKAVWAWWMLEVLPFTYRVRTEKNGRDSWRLAFWPNFGRPRATPDGRMKVHVSVHERMQRTNYTPKVRWHEEPMWIE
ncbi:hypothetical protein DACRYDRAFT_82033 [Dacryopinax primogenitus]|uniref:T6SS Phospholipase effector Tle1-like catalytic domain-containing protein n=1 Tax=Dacryopinax primogenitus (strain DJM 731) TaxID=1858805 RepID=M5G785_DACPD|nr:uncharacterized protein DACRYDRAFT_82033 [Dacryopinax primogenitus]EJT99622.1 hypothetical protein DACRYDRAFT_82033 [Dacryopinax primogenitus]